MSLESSIATFFQLYAAAFTNCDAVALSDLWAYPAYITSAERSAAFDDAESFQANTELVCDFYKRQGFVRADEKILAASKLHDGVASVRVQYRLFDAQDQLIIEWEHAYLVRNMNGRWKAIVAIADGEIAAWKARGTPLGSN